MEMSIERFLKKTFDAVVDVKFRKVGVYLAGDDRSIERTQILILIDPEGVLKGNFNPNKSNFVGHDLKREIWRTIDTMFSLNVEEYGSDWDIEFKVLSVY